MKRILPSILLLVVSACWLGAQGAALAFRDDNDVSRAMAEYVMSGKVPITNGFVYSGNELAKIIDYGGRVGNSTDFKSRFIFSINPAVTSVSGITIYNPSPASDPTLLYFVDSLPVFTELGADFSLGDSVAGKAKIDLSVRPTFVGTDDISLFAPWNVDSLLRTLLSWKFPQEGWIATGSGNAWIAAGRFKAGLGEGHFGNTFLNTRAEWYDQIQGAVGNENFRFTSIIGSSATHLYRGEAAIQFRTRDPLDYNSVENSINPWDPINDHDFVTTMEPVKMFAYSQVEARFWDRFRFGVAQMNMIGGKVPGLIDFLPTTFWHNTYAAGFGNVMLNLNASLVPYKGVQLFGEFTVDDFRGTDEGATGKPSQFAYQGGGRYSFKPIGDLLVTAGGEYTFASEWVYCRWQPYLTMYQRHLINGSQGTDWPLGFAYGPDARHLGIFVNASLPTGAKAEIGYEYLMKGPIYMGMTDAVGNPVYYDYGRTDWTDNAAPSTTLAAIQALPDQLSHGISLKATWPLPLGFEVYGRLQYWDHTNFRNLAGNSKQFLLVSTGAVWKY
jgi:hypothetical protein